MGGSAECWHHTGSPSVLRVWRNKNGHSGQQRHPVVHTIVEKKKMASQLEERSLCNNSIFQETVRPAMEIRSTWRWTSLSIRSFLIVSPKLNCALWFSWCLAIWCVQRLLFYISRGHRTVPVLHFVSLLFSTRNFIWKWKCKPRRRSKSTGKAPEKMGLPNIFLTLSHNPPQRLHICLLNNSLHTRV